MKRFKIPIVITAVIIILSISFFCIKNISKPSKVEDKIVSAENEKMATTLEKEEVKPTATSENPIPKEEPTTTPVATPDNSDKVTTPSDNSNTITNSKNTTSTTSNTGSQTTTSTKSGTTSGSGSTSVSTGGTSSGSTGESTSGGTTPTPTTPTPAPTPTPVLKYTPSYTLKEDLATEIFNAVSKYRQDNGLGALTRVSTYNTTAQNYLSYKIDGQPKPDITNIFAHYTTQEGGWDANALAGVIGRADRWQGGNICSVKVAQKGENYYICFIVK